MKYISTKEKLFISVNKFLIRSLIIFEIFPLQARKIEAAGAVGGIVVDNTEGSSSDTAQVFAMSGDGTNDVNIPVVFLFHKEGKILHDAVAERPGIIKVMLVDKARSDGKMIVFVIILSCQFLISDFSSRGGVHFHPR